MSIIFWGPLTVTVVVGGIALYHNDIAIAFCKAVAQALPVC